LSRPRPVAHPYPQANLLSSTTPSRSQAVNQSFALYPVEIEIPGSVREHVSAGLKAKDLRIWLIAVHDATLHVCQDGPCNVSVEQYAITISPKLQFSLADSCVPIPKHQTKH